MPIYEFLCESCNVVFSFHSFRIDTTTVPACPRCGGGRMVRVPSRFGVGTVARRNGADLPGDGGGPDLDDSGLEREMMRLASEMEGMDENDPRQMAQLVRRMADLTGEPVTPAMEEMIRRLEAGEDPEAVEEALGDEIEAEMEETAGKSGEPARDDGIYPLR